MIDVQHEKLTLHVQDDKVRIKVFEVMKYSTKQWWVFSSWYHWQDNDREVQRKAPKVTTRSLHKLLGFHHRGKQWKKGMCALPQGYDTDIKCKENKVWRAWEGFAFIDSIHPRSFKSWTQRIAFIFKVCIFRRKFNIANNYFLVFNRWRRREAIKSGAFT